MSDYAKIARPGIRVAVNMPIASGSTSGLVSAALKKRYTLTRWALTFSDSTDVKFTDGTSDISGIYQVGNGVFSGEISFKAGDWNRPLKINSSVAVTKVSGDIWYEEEEQLTKQTTNLKVYKVAPHPEQ